MKEIYKLPVANIVLAWSVVPVVWIMSIKFSNDSQLAKVTLLNVYLAIAMASTVINLALIKSQEGSAKSRLALYSTSAMGGLLYCGVFVFPSYFLNFDNYFVELSLPIYTLVWLVLAFFHSSKFFSRYKMAVDFVVDQYQSKGSVSLFELIYRTSNHEEYFAHQFNKNMIGIVFSIVLLLLLVLSLNLRNAYPIFSAYSMATTMSFIMACVFETLVMNIYFVLVLYSAERRLKCKVPPLIISQKERLAIIKKFRRA